MGFGTFIVRHGWWLSAACVFGAPLIVSGQVRFPGPGGASAVTPTAPVRPEPAVASAEAPGVDIPLGGSNEPTIAVNPLDPNNLAMASLFHARISIDGGATWSSSILAPVPTTHFSCGDPSLAFDSQGRLFWTYLGCLAANGNLDIFITQLNPSNGAVLPGYPVNVTASLDMPASAGFFHDKEWLAADCFDSSPFTDRLHLVWTELNSFDRPVLSSFSTDQGLTWSAAIQLSGPGEGFTWPAHVAVAPNGDVYAAYHSQTGFNGIGELGGNPTGGSGKVFVARSTNGGASFDQKNLAYSAGQADITFNVQSSPGTIPLTDFWLQGSAQPWVLPDPVNPGAIYVIANDDPDNNHGSGDDADVFIVRSFDNGLTWSALTQINGGPSGLFEVMPTAAIDKQTGDILVSWYSNASLAFNNNGNFLLDLFFAVSQDQGATFYSTDTQVNDSPFDPDLGAPQRLSGPPPTLRIGEYNGVAIANNQAHFVWTGNTSTGQQIITDTLDLLPPPPPCQDLTGDGDVNGVDLAVLLSVWGTNGQGSGADFNNDGVVDGADLATLLTSWGPCP